MVGGTAGLEPEAGHLSMPVLRRAPPVDDGARARHGRRRHEPPQACAHRVRAGGKACRASALIRAVARDPAAPHRPGLAPAAPHALTRTRTLTRAGLEPQHPVRHPSRGPTFPNRMTSSRRVLTEFPALVKGCVSVSPWS